MQRGRDTHTHTQREICLGHFLSESSRTDALTHSIHFLPLSPSTTPNLTDTRLALAPLATGSGSHLDYLPFLQLPRFDQSLLVYGWNQRDELRSPVMRNDRN